MSLAKFVAAGMSVQGEKVSLPVLLLNGSALALYGFVIEAFSLGTFGTGLLPFGSGGSNAPCARPGVS